MCGRQGDTFRDDGPTREEAEYALADRLACPSEFVARTFRERGFREEQLARHQYGFDPAVFTPAQASGAGGAETNGHQGLRVAFVGRCEPRKGLHFALRAWIESGRS